MTKHNKDSQQGRETMDEEERDWFNRFERASWKPDEIRERIFIHARADYAPDIFKFLIRNILDQPDIFPGVEMAKIANPPALSNRTDNIVIYTTGTEATERVLKALRTYQKIHSHHFMNDFPKMTEGKFPGVSVAEEPLPPWRGLESFASLRIKAITDALLQTTQEGKDKEYYKQLVDKKLREVGVDPLNPHRNLRPGKKIKTSLEDRLMIARDMIIKVLDGTITHRSDRHVFDDDLFYFNVRIIEEFDLKWLQAQLARPEYDEQARQEVLINMAKKRS
jgi:hypothetical protein